MYIIGKFRKVGYIRFVGHLDLIGLFEKAFKRAGFILDYTQGFNPQPIISIANPLPLGVESECEYIQVETSNTYNLEEIIGKINDELPKGIEFLSLEKSRKIKLDKEIKYASYDLTFPNSVDMDRISEIMEKITSSEEYIIMRKKVHKKKRTYQVPFDIKSFIIDYKVDKDKNMLSYYSKANIGGTLRAESLVEAFNLEGININIQEVRVKRTGQYDLNGESLI